MATNWREIVEITLFNHWRTWPRPVDGPARALAAMIPSGTSTVEALDILAEAIPRWAGGFEQMAFGAGR